MTSQEPWERFTARNEVHVVGEFKNELGERFVIYRMKNGDKAYFTGDEVDWEPKLPLLWGDFVFSEYERGQVAKILWPTFAEQWKAAAEAEFGTREHGEIKTWPDYEQAMAHADARLGAELVCSTAYTRGWVKVPDEVIRKVTDD